MDPDRLLNRSQKILTKKDAPNQDRTGDLGISTLLPGMSQDYETHVMTN